MSTNGFNLRSIGQKTVLRKEGKMGNKKFEPGDVVKIKSDYGPEMTVEKYPDPTRPNDVQCIWFNHYDHNENDTLSEGNNGEWELNREIFDERALVKLSREE